jgi:hypothetical protein
MCTYDVMVRLHVEVSVGGTQQKIHKPWQMMSLPSPMPTMPTTANLKNLIQYIIVAATAAKNIAETAKVPFLGSTAALCLSITKSVEVSQFFWPLAPYLAKKKQTIRSNKEEYAEIMEQIHEILCIIAQLHSTSEIEGVLPTTLLYDIAKFTE